MFSSLEQVEALKGYFMDEIVEFLLGAPVSVKMMEFLHNFGHDVGEFECFLSVVGTLAEGGCRQEDGRLVKFTVRCLREVSPRSLRNEDVGQLGDE